MSCLSRNKFIGTWKLCSFTSLLENGEEIYTYGEKPVGYIIYTPEGYVQATLMSEKFPQLQNEPASILHFLSYCGRYEIKEKVVTHNMDVASVSAWAGGKQDRAYRFLEDGKLELSTVEKMDILGQIYIGNKLIWERV